MMPSFPYSGAALPVEAAPPEFFLSIAGPERPDDDRLDHRFEMLLDDLQELLDADEVCEGLPQGDPALTDFTARAETAWAAAVSMAEEVIRARRSVSDVRRPLCRAAMQIRRALRADAVHIVDEAIADLGREFSAAMKMADLWIVSCGLARCWSLLARLRSAWTASNSLSWQQS